MGFVVTFTVRVAVVPAGEGATEPGLIEHVAPLGAPLQLSATASANPFCPVTLMVTFPDCPTPTVREFEDRVAAKSPISN